MPEAVNWAIATQYDLSKNLEKDSVEARAGLRLLLADQIDKLAGYLGIGQVPSGSSDPMGLRRAATLCIEATWKRWDLDFAGLLSVAVTMYSRQDFDLDVEGAKKAAKDIFVSRYEAMLPDKRHDLIEAATMEDYGWEAMKPKQVLARLALVEQLAADVSFIQTASRPLNIVRAAKEKGEAFEHEEPLKKLDRAALNSPDGVRLAEALDATQTSSQGIGVKELKALEAPINAFFESTMVMSQDAKERQNRLTLVHAVGQVLSTAGDLSKIVIEGD
jgi:glycyl-tRNA synthetase beta chain